MNFLYFSLFWVFRRARDNIIDMVKVLLDTNVFIDADRGQGSFGQRIIELVINNQIVGIISRPVRNENNLIINRLIKDNDLKTQISTYFSKCKKVEPVRIDVRLDDKEDVKILASAVAGAVSFLITEDRHLLELDEYRGVKIVRPREWWQWWESQQDSSGETWGNWAKNVLGK